MGRHGLNVRGDSLYCPLAFSLDPYWWCAPDCPHCYLRHLNYTWGKEFRPLDIEALDRKLTNGLNNASPKSPLAWVLKNKNTMRVGNKADPFQPIELKKGVTRRALRVLRKHKWSFVIQTRFTNNLLETCEDSLMKATRLELAQVMPVIPPGFDKDWEIMDQKRTTPPSQKIADIKTMLKMGVKVGVNGEPFIPGWHTVKEFEDMLKLLKSIGVSSYNTYNFHFTPFVAKRIAGLPGVDLEAIWRMNQDHEWRKILQQLCDLSLKYEITLGCPDFVNTGAKWIEPANTCCGLDVPNPTKFNTHYFKLLSQQGCSAEAIEKACWDGSADREKGRAVIRGESSEFYTLRDAGVL